MVALWHSFMNQLDNLTQDHRSRFVLELTCLELNEFVYIQAGGSVLHQCLRMQKMGFLPVLHQCFKECELIDLLFGKLKVIYIFIERRGIT